MTVLSQHSLLPGVFAAVNLWSLERSNFVAWTTDGLDTMLSWDNHLKYFLRHASAHSAVSSDVLSAITRHVRLCCSLNKQPAH